MWGVWEGPWYRVLQRSLTWGALGSACHGAPQGPLTWGAMGVPDRGISVMGCHGGP